MCSDVYLLDEIETCVHGITRVAIEASKFLDYYILKILEKGEEEPKLDQSFFYSASTTIAGSSLPLQLRAEDPNKTRNNFMKRFIREAGPEDEETFESPSS
eukprot:NODE_29_length_33183_cov_0.333666.p31 type:complete len:101 gc:universal NODE_29_length_33183_cov_0.333666:632-330(-)